MDTPPTVTVTSNLVKQCFDEEQIQSRDIQLDEDEDEGEDEYDIPKLDDDAIAATIQIANSFYIPFVASTDKIAFIHDYTTRYLYQACLNAYETNGTMGVIKHIIKQMVSSESLLLTSEPLLGIIWLLSTIKNNSELYDMFNKLHALPPPMLYSSMTNSLEIDGINGKIDWSKDKAIFSKEVDIDIQECIYYVCDWINAVIDDDTFKLISSSLPSVTDRGELFIYVTSIIVNTMKQRQSTSPLQDATYLRAVMDNPYWDLQYFLLLPLPPLYA